ncbi:MAG: Rieske 2Fe-2S domain-containing protein [Labilithrix sp.]|nr:Rieske 2Fe-2S domain-containing protein [Labilithrix sp.]
MEANRQVELVRRALAHVAARTTDRDERPTTLPARAYVDEAQYARELQILFRESPIPVAHASQLAAPGDFVTHDLTGVPLLIVRGDDGALAGFLNVCRHRGTRVEGAACGKGKKGFVCPYHAWSYGRDGRLLAMTHAHGFEGVERESRGLVRVPVTEAGGLVWARASRATSRADEELDAALGPLADDLLGFGIGSSHVYAPRTFERSMSWKLAMDVFLETYHLRPTHKNTIYEMFFDNLGLVDRVGPHLRNLFPKRSIVELAKEPDAIVGGALRKHANILFHLFPNTLVLVQPDHAAVISAWPIAIDRVRMHAYTLVPEPPLSEKARAYWDANNAILYGATDEDFAMGESIQRGLASGANEEIVFGAFEHALAHFHGEVARRVG